MENHLHAKQAPRRDAPVRREMPPRPFSLTSTDAAGALPVAQGAVFQQMLSLAQGSRDGGSNSDSGSNGRPQPASEAACANSSIAEAADAAAQAMAERLGPGLNDGAFEVLLPGGSHLAVRHWRTQGVLQLELRASDAGWARRLHAERGALVQRLRQRSGQAVVLQLA